MGFFDSFPIVGDILDFAGGLASNASNMKIAKQDREWKERMANTAHQREVSDLEAAGLNPMLGIMKGSGGSDTPATHVPEIRNPLSGAGDRLRANKAQSALLQAQVGNVLADTDAKGAAASLSRASAAQVSAMTDPSVQHMSASAESTRVGIGKIEQEIKNLRAHFDSILETVRGQRISNAQLEELNPIILDLQRLERLRRSYEMPKSRLIGEGAEALRQGVEARKPIGRAIGEGVGAYIEHLRRGGVPGWIIRKLQEKLK